MQAKIDEQRAVNKTVEKQLLLQNIKTEIAKQSKQVCDAIFNS